MWGGERIKTGCALTVAFLPTCNVVLQCGEEVSHCGQTEADIRVDGESGKSGAAMSKVSSSYVMKSSWSSLLLHSLVYLFFRVSIFFNTPMSFINAVEDFNREECVPFSRNTLNRH